VLPQFVDPSMVRPAFSCRDVRARAARTLVGAARLFVNGTGRCGRSGWKADDCEHAFAQGDAAMGY
jgi:hypothetical protein